jgi:hypothetical protein
MRHFRRVATWLALTLSTVLTGHAFADDIQRFALKGISVELKSVKWGYKIYVNGKQSAAYESVTPANIVGIYTESDTVAVLIRAGHYDPNIKQNEIACGVEYNLLIYAPQRSFSERIGDCGDVRVAQLQDRIEIVTPESRTLAVSRTRPLMLTYVLKDGKLLRSSR